MSVKNLISKEFNPQKWNREISGKKKAHFEEELKAIISDTETFVKLSKLNQTDSLQNLKKIKARLIKVKAEAESSAMESDQILSDDVKKMDQISSYIGDLYTIFTAREINDLESNRPDTISDLHERYLIHSTSIANQLKKQVILIIQDLLVLILNLTKITLTTVDAVSSLSLVKALKILLDGSILSTKSSVIFNNIRIIHQLNEENIFQRIQAEVRKIDQTVSKVVADIYSKYIGHRSYAKRRENYLIISRLITLQKRLQTVQQQLQNSLCPSLSKEMDKLQSEELRADAKLQENMKALLAMQDTFAEISQLSDSAFSIIEFLKKRFKDNLWGEISLTL